MRDWHIVTNSGKRLNLFELSLHDIDIRDIAHSLAHINRFNGHTDIPISVAQHSVFVMSLCRDQPLEVRRTALLHDASEAYIGDVTKWLKASSVMEGYRDVEQQIQHLIYTKFGCHGDCSPVVEADKLMVRFEAEVGYIGRWQEFDGYPLVTSDERHRIQAEYIWEPWNPIRAKSQFLRQFHRVCNQS